ncbi:MAG: RAMP superfamily CRISPR-associated protein [Coleofasciculus chthonoplastes F3-SA18-01]|uniref:RAMP superfamily CRISPR-associated protein n=1 Tax=Coleofasciculus chthonoplastes TaxID=64178 RepID=UPI0032FE1983
MSREREGRHIVKRIIVCGVLVLDTPTCLGNGDAEGPTDLMLLRDSISAKALLTGSSIAGSLRNYLHEYKGDYGKSERRQDIAAKLFGDLFAYEDEKHLPEQQKLKTKEQDTQSPLIIDDAFSRDSPRIELRDGVKIDSATGTGADQAKYDLELLSAGTQFPLNFELLIDRENDENQLREALALALEGLKSGEISIGMKKRRGFGRCHVDEWQVWEFDLRQHRDRVAWLTLDRSWSKPYAKPPTTSQSIAAALGVTPAQPDKRDRFFLEATFKLASPLLIRSGQDSTGCAPDVVHLRSHRDGELKPVLSGTSLAGVLRHRAERIVNTLDKPEKIVNDVFGFVEENSKQAKASRLVVHESVIESTADLVQNRIAIDRFTGGAYHGALFSEQPIFGSDKTRLTLELELRQPRNAEIGLLLLLLKDLWTRDLPVGGESSIGRGRLQGIEAKMRRQLPGKATQSWIIFQDGEHLQVSDANTLESFVNDFSGEVIE